MKGFFRLVRSGGEGEERSVTPSCVPYEMLERYVSGRVSSQERGEVEAHASRCEGCRLALAALGLALEPGSIEEEALVAWMARTRPVPALLQDLGLPPAEPARGGFPHVREVAPSRSRFRWAARRLGAGVGAMAAGLAAAAVAAFVFWPAGHLPVPPERAILGRPAGLEGYAPFVPKRGTDTGGLHWEELEAAHAAKGGSRGAVPVLLARGGLGDWERARALLEQAPVDAARENDLGVLDLAGGDAAAALAAFERALALDEDFLPAHFNRALALEALGRKEEARQAWERYLALARGTDGGWVEEARRRLGN